jgi:hypothetical protein
MPELKIEIGKGQKDITYKQLDILRRVSNVLTEHGFQVSVRWRASYNHHYPKIINLDLG